MKLPDAEVGRRLKIRLARTIGRSIVLGLDLHAIHEEDEKLRGRGMRGPKRRESPRRALVAAGKLVRAEIVCNALGITEKRLSKDVARARIFNVEVQGTQYYPAFVLADELDRKDVAKVTRRLDGLSGWKKWEFFTESKRSLGELTPLQALVRGEVKRVLMAAAAVVEQSQNLESRNVPGPRKA
ncbi:hypothetical protein [Caballeronia sp. BR00000012568055]|uniref:hypothetical protein n=1 Tax=Caballeronia sp. BR00000012568055 TaxID=2918761 RepID=UPI0023F7A403|nr:hypothetical protein [Caballeronia sp. BR00000012568055]